MLRRSRSENRFQSLILTVGMIGGCTIFANTHASEEGCELGIATQLELNQCAADDLDAADAELNRVYDEIRRRYQDDDVFLGKLKEAQRAWIAFRDAELGAIFPHSEQPRYYGSMLPYCLQSWLSLMTRQRILELRRWLAEPGEEGDICTGSFPSGG